MAISRARSFLLPAVLVAAGGVIALASGAFRAPAATAQTDARPNIIVILVDDMGWSDIGSYGGEIPTPNLDALATRGVRFTQFYSTPRCSPTGSIPIRREWGISTTSSAKGRQGRRAA
jgi:arylsulfatase